MSLPFFADIRLEADNYSFAETHGFVCVNLSPDASRDKVIRMAYCIHCHRLKSYSWTNSHWRQLMDEGVNPHAFFDAEKVPVYKGNIETELQLQWEEGKLSSLQCGERVPSAFRPTQGFTVDQNDELLSHRSVQATDAVHLPVDSPTLEVPEHNPERLFEHDMQCAEECLLRDCFGLCGFEKDVFLCISRHVLERLSSSTDASRPNRIKARMITIIVRKIVRDLALSKNQTTQVVDMLKAVIGLVALKDRGRILF